MDPIPQAGGPGRGSGLSEENGRAQCGGGQKAPEAVLASRDGSGKGLTARAEGGRGACRAGGCGVLCLPRAGRSHGERVMAQRSLDFGRRRPRIFRAWVGWDGVGELSWVGL
jgi:hypothetical protein